ncbi:MAG: hypothetical protein WD033_06170 [Nitrosopumilaceae archaeon]
MELSRNPLSKQQKAFLESKNPLGFNKSQYQGDILNHVDNSIRYLHHILKHPYNLKKCDIYDRLNALTLVEVIKNSLTDLEQKSLYRSEKYDFRTVELARMLFEISTIYLIKSPLWNNKQFVQTDIDRLSYYFEALADYALDKESRESFKEEKERKLKEELEEIRQKEKFIKYNPEGEWCIFNKQYEKCLKKQNDYNTRLEFLDSQKKDLKVKKEIKILKDLSEGLKKAIYDIQNHREKSLKDITKERDQISKELSQKFEHFEPFYCPYDRLAPFEYKNNIHLRMRPKKN